MKITLLPSCIAHDGVARPDQYLTSLLVNDTIAIDAGSLGYNGTPFQQEKVRHVLITHTHSDHIASLPLFVESVYAGRPDCVTLYGSDDVLDCLRRDVFNDRVWPDFLRLSEEMPQAPFLRLQRLEAGKPLVLDGLRFIPVPVDHLVPTLGFIIEEPGSSVVVPSDTGPTRAIWELADRESNLRAVFLEVAFPDEMAWLAESSKHLTPAMFAAEVAKLHERVRVLAVHIKPRFRDRVIAQLQALGLPNVEVCKPGHAYEF